MDFFRTHLIAVIVGILASVASVIAGIIVGLNQDWIAGLITFVVVLVVGNGLAGLIAAINMMRLTRDF